MQEPLCLVSESHKTSLLSSHSNKNLLVFQWSIGFRTSERGPIVNFFVQISKHFSISWTIKKAMESWYIQTNLIVNWFAIIWCFYLDCKFSTVVPTIETLRSRTCGRPVVSQSFGAPNQHRAPSLRRSWPWNNNINNSRRIMNNSVRSSYHIWVVRVRLFFGRMVLGTTSILLLFQLRHCSSSIFFWNTLKL